jgi:hypothetical protein
MKPKLTYDIARSAGMDAGNRSMRKANRAHWNEDDFNAAARETNRLIDIIESARKSEPDGPIADSCDGYKVKNEMEET